MKIKLLSAIVALLSLAACNGQPGEKIHTIDAKTFAEKLKATSEPQLIDVRTPEEFASEKIANAKNINWNDPSFTANASLLDKSKPVFVYCKAGGRSAQAASKLAELGFSEIYNLDGGIMKWNASGNAKPSASIIGICDQEYGELTKSYDKVLVDFNAKWCGPCQKMKPYILKMQAEMKDKVKIVQLDADENKTIVEQLQLEGLPTLILYEKGKEAWRNVGYITEEDLKKHL